MADISGLIWNALVKFFRLLIDSQAEIVALRGGIIDYELSVAPIPTANHIRWYW
jgi:hypothetical protein